MAERDDRRDRDPSGTIGRNIEAFMLLELLRAPSYGRDLIRCLDNYGFRRATAEPGVVYKVLRALEDTGAIRSTWATRESGPARRYYEITEPGRLVLRHRAHQLQRYLVRVEQLLENYRQLTGEDPSVQPAADGLEQRDLVLTSTAEENR